MTAGIAGLVHAETTKLRSVRSSVWLLVGGGVSVVAFAMIIAAVQAGDWSSMSPQERSDLAADPIGNTLPAGALWGALAASILGVLVITSEYSTGTIRTSMLAVPRRTPILVAKAGALVGATLVVVEMAAFVSYVVARALLHDHVSMTLGAKEIAAVASLGLYVAVIGLFAVSVGAIVRHVAGGLTVVLVCTVLVPMVTSQLGDLGEAFKTLLPGSNAGQAIIGTTSDPDAFLSPWASFGITCGWTALLFAVAVRLLNRRDA